MKHLYLLILCAVLITGEASQAQITLEGQTPSRSETFKRDLENYQLGIELCTQFQVTGSLKFAYFGSRDLLVKGRLLDVSDELKQVLGSYSFHEALRDCYPGDSKASSAKRTAIVASLIAADVAGKSAAAIGIIKMYSLVGRVLAEIKLMSLPAYYSVQTATLLPAVYTAYRQYKELRRQQEERGRQIDFTKGQIQEFSDPGKLAKFQSDLEKAIEAKELILDEKIKQSKSPAEKRKLEGQLEILRQLKIQQQEQLN